MWRVDKLMWGLKVKGEGHLGERNKLQMRRGFAKNFFQWQDSPKSLPLGEVEFPQE